jgi:mannose-6-phosphate isomerase-like protein (cupin superfamily)
MIKYYKNPSIIEAAGQPPKRIEEYIGRVNSNDTQVSIARMVSPAGWVEPAQTPEFDEYTVVLKGTLHLVFIDSEMDLKAGEALLVSQGTQVQYSSPYPGGAEYISVCLPAFSPQLVHRHE